MLHSVCILCLGTYHRALGQLTSSCFQVTRRHMSVSPLINDPKYSFLRNELDLKEENNGVFDGTWFGNGDVSIPGEWKVYCNKNTNKGKHGLTLK